MKVAGGARRHRPRRVLVLGGARSGKSAYAESRLRTAPAVLYVAPGAIPGPDDAEWAARVALHQARRPAAWTTAETTDLEAILAADGPPVLIDCLSTWLAAVMDDCGIWTDRPGADAALTGRVSGLAAAWSASRRAVVAVSSEVGLGIVPATVSGRRFRDELGRLNAAVAAGAHEVWFVTAGIARAVKP